jgi:hypothetical protein
MRVCWQVRHLMYVQARSSNRYDDDSVNIIFTYVYTVIISGYAGGVDTTKEVTQAMTTQQPTGGRTNIR